MTKAVDDSAPIFNMAEAVAKFAPKVDNSRKARKSRHKTVSNATDGRSLRASGRTAQFNFKALPELKPAAQQAAREAGLTLAEWMEAAVNAALGEGRVDA